MKQQLGIITLGIKNLDHSKKFYIEGFGWQAVYEDDETVMYQMNGFVLATWLQSELENDITKYNLIRGGAITLAHNVDSPEKVQMFIVRLSEYGGKVLRIADTPSHGGVRGYIADPDDHIWEIIYNTIWKVEPQKGSVTYSPLLKEGR